ncbi:MAG: HPr family phosphocarrier protein [Gammaproteobacteria bacterium]|nr:HPr family phosphocarrier protein [Gammaproteobacteria bacterium]
MEKEVEVINKLGLHARAAAKLVKLCANYESHIMLYKGEKGVDAKSIMGVLMLAATQGTTLSLHVEGGDAEDASDSILALFGGCFDEGE